MKLRNQLLALLCLLAFAAFGVVYFQQWVVQKPFGIVLFIGEGLTADRLTTARIYAGGADSRLALESMPAVALLANYSNDFAVPDQPAAASALATGAKVNNRSLALDPDAKPLRTILERARRSGRAVGLVTNTKLTDPTAAAFYAHTADQNDTDRIAAALIDSAKLDLLMGGGAAAFFPESKGGRRRDSRDLLLEFRRGGYDVVRSKAELERIPAWRAPKLAGFFADGDLPFSDRIASGDQQPGLPDLVRRAVELLQFNPRGYLLVVDSGLMRKAAQENNGERTLAETVELDRSVALARRYAGRKSLVLVVGDCAVGGMTLNGFPFRKDSGVALLGMNSSGYPSLTWATGPKGGHTYGVARLSGSAPSPSAGENADAEPPPPEQEPAAFFAPSAINAAGDMLAVASGPGSEALHGFLDDTAIYRIINDNL